MKNCLFLSLSISSSRWKKVSGSEKQVKDYLLCQDCEYLFNKNGEHWVMQQVYNGKDFPLLDRLKLALHVYADPMLQAYAGAAVGIDTGKLAYFALSVLWRAAVHNWAMHDGQTTSISVGAYEEPIRRFLLGETAFPVNIMVLTTVCTDAPSRESFSVPCLVPDNPFIALYLYTCIFISDVGASPARSTRTC